MAEIHLPTFDTLSESSPYARQQFTDPNGQQGMIVDTRQPLHRLRRSELLKMAEQAGFDVSGTPFKDDLIKMLEAPASVRAQVNANRNLREAKEDAALKKAMPAVREYVPVDAKQAAPAYTLREPEAHEIEAAREETRRQMHGMPFFKLKSILASHGISYVKGDDRAAKIEACLKAIDEDEMR